MSQHHHAAIEAERFFNARKADLPVHREAMLGGCAVHLAWTFTITNTAAMQIAMNVLSEIESAGVEAFIEIDRCNSRMVMVRDTARRSVHMVSVAELLRLVRDRNPHHQDPPPAAG